MSDDWQPGDLALCVRFVDGQGLGDDAKAGAVYTVARVIVHRDGDILLHFHEINHSRRVIDGYYAAGYCTFNFRKIHPLTEAERREVSDDHRAPVLA